MTAAVTLNTEGFVSFSILQTETVDNYTFDNVLNNFSNQTGETNSSAKTYGAGLTYNYLSETVFQSEEPDAGAIIENIIEKTKEKYGISDNETGLTSDNKDKMIQISQLLDLVISLMMSKSMDGNYEAGDYPKLSEMIKEFTSMLNNIATVNTNTLDEMLEKLTDMVLEMSKEENEDNGIEKSDKFEQICRERIKQYEMNMENQTLDGGGGEMVTNIEIPLTMESIGI